LTPLGKCLLTFHLTFCLPPAALFFALPGTLQYSDTLLAGDELLICGWMGYTFMWELIAELDHSDQVRQLTDTSLSASQPAGLRPRHLLWMLSACPLSSSVVCAHAWLISRLQGLPNGSRVTLFNEHKWTVEYLRA
jgi:hypothetical protein